MNIYEKLQELEEKKAPIRVGVVGAGQMGSGMIAQIATIPGMAVGGISDVDKERGQRAADAYLASAPDATLPFVTTDFREMIAHPGVDVIVEATGLTEVGANVAMQALLHRKHLVLLNVEIDITVGSLLYKLFKNAGLVYSGSDGDEPAATFELVNFAKVMGMEVLVAGKGKNNKLRPSANPDSVADEAKQRHMSPHMLASFADGTKTMAEMNLLANATGFLPDRTGMHGISGDLNTTVEKLRLKSEGGILNSYQVVEYVDGIAPGVFVIVKGQNQGVVDELNYMMKQFRDHQILYRPFHLGSLETPISVARAILFGESAIRPLGRPYGDTVAVAKRSIKKGEPIDGIGGYCVRGVLEEYTLARKEKHIPIGLIAGKTYAKQDIEDGTFLTEDDIQLDESTTVWKLRMLQEKLIG